GSATSSDEGSSKVEKMCSGTIGINPTADSCAKVGTSKVISTVWCPVATASTMANAAVLVAGTSLIIRKVKTTSSASNASPSVHLTPSRRATVNTVPSSFHSNSVASHGSGISTSTSVVTRQGSKMGPSSPWSAMVEYGFKLRWTVVVSEALMRIGRSSSACCPVLQAASAVAEAAPTEPSIIARRVTSGAIGGVL